MSAIPDYYLPDSQLSLRLSSKDDSTITVTVVKAFTPFTINQVVLVRTAAELSSGLDIATTSLVILKVFDPRFSSKRDRMGLTWSAATEATAAAKRIAQWDPNFDGADYPDEDDALGWEEWFYQKSELQFRSEAKVFELLAELQGEMVPRCFATGSLICKGRTISPHVLLQEFIPDAKTLEEVTPSVVDLQLLQSLATAVGVFGRLGVVHTDLNPENILFTPGDHPTRAVIIDFGNAYFREEEDDEGWSDIVSQWDDLRGLKVAFLQNSLKIDNLNFERER